MADTVYNVAKARVASGATDLDTSTLKMLLLKTTAAGAFNPDLVSVTALKAVSGVVEADFTGYVRKTLTSVTVTQDDTNDRANVDSANVTWDPAGGATNNTPVAAVIYHDVDGTDANSKLVSYHDTNFGVTATNGSPYTVNIADFVRLT
ncbi:MAG: hypothetical protein DMF62_04855 [Acidobacteria bacterium]|nr:MAG: hypothetical protein DMF62_04855 [Acidobacteriota bacterium]